MDQEFQQIEHTSQFCTSMNVTQKDLRDLRKNEGKDKNAPGSNFGTSYFGNVIKLQLMEESVNSSH